MHHRRAELYELLHRTGYVEQDHSPLRARPEDYFPIMSERPEFIPEYGQALKRSQYEANTWMVQMYAGLAIDHRRHYRQYYVVHTSSTKSSWTETCQNISEVISPDRCIEYFQQSSEGAEAVFNFYEWAFPEKAPAVAS
jgi:chromo domain-containing protein 1